MAINFRPKTPFTVAMKLLIPLAVETAKGNVKKTYPSPDDAPLIYGSFRTYGGTEITSNNTYTVQDTATIETWFRPDITSDCRLYVIGMDRTYEVKGSPENIEMRNQYLLMRVQSVGGKA
jgi:head-tail adaptor